MFFSINVLQTESIALEINLDSKTDNLIYQPNENHLRTYAKRVQLTLEQTSKLSAASTSVKAGGAATNMAEPYQVTVVAESMCTEQGVCVEIVSPRGNVVYNQQLSSSSLESGVRLFYQLPICNGMLSSFLLQRN